MRKAFLLVAGLLLAGLSLQPASAWFHGGGWGGVGMHEGAFGGHWGAVGGAGHWGAGGVTPSGHAWGATGNGYGWHGASTGGYHAAGNYNGWAAVGPNGHWATGSRYYGGAYGGAYVHSPAVVNGYYGGVGCWACGGWGTAAGVAAGAVAGAAVTSAAVAGAAAGATAASGYYPVGAVYSALPPGCAYTPYGGLTYYSCYGSWFRPYYGANGTYYHVVGAP
jgi:hypothetical protein